MQPLLICMTPIRNEAWVLHAFLKAASLWADYIIIADQQSTDGSREIALSYAKVILIENNNSDFNEAERQSMLINKAREIEGDKILFGLDADEIFAANYMHTNDWQRILTSKPGDVFWFKWAELCPDKHSYWESPTTYYPWVFHDDGVEPHGNYVRNMHSMRIPYPIEEKQLYYVDDFRVLHLAYLNTARVDAKRRFYKFVDWELNKRSIISLSRSYSQIKKDPVRLLQRDMLYTKENGGFELFENVDLDSNKFWFDDYVIERLNRYPIKKIGQIDIWEKDFIKNYQVRDPRTILQKCIHLYSLRTNKIRRNIVVVLIDKILRKAGW